VSLYNLICGQSPQAPFVMALLDPVNVGRFRDAWVERSDGGEVVLAVFTRNGGGNRQHHGEKPAGPGCDCTGCIITHVLPAHPLYLRDADDEYDCTYATVYFRVPEIPPWALDEDPAEQVKQRAAMRELFEEIARPKPDTRARWQAAVDAIGSRSGR